MSAAGRVTVFGSATAVVAALLLSAPGAAGSTDTVGAAVATAASANRIDGRARDIKDRIAALPGVTKVVERDAARHYRFFKISFTQPVDHDNPAAGTFQQRLTLLHRNTARPMVMYTSGYNVASYPFLSEPAQIVLGNQLNMEYRFFTPSRPADPDWEQQLTIEQAAADEHHVIRVFKRIYQQRWITTGGSKGGMTATYHRRFYPHDVSGTVAYVAPNDVVDGDDGYNEFLENVGTNPGCRATLVDLQRRVLSDRDWFLAKVERVSAHQGLTYHITGDVDLAMEAATVDMYFTFWQYSPQSDCRQLPDPDTATNPTIWRFFSFTSPLTGYSDQWLRPYVPYYFQAAYQLGAPAPYETHLADLLQHPGADVARTFVPDRILPSTFDASAMPDIDHWVRTESTQMLFVYGGNDPWGAEPFACGADQADRQCARYFVSGGNHGAVISQLSPAKRRHATELVLSWAGLGPGDPAVRAFEHPDKAETVPWSNHKPDYLRRLLP
ncbi:MAG TPA: S28 family serine protease [Nocardioidaceae bacterium]|nr:S28 family serine protease [Nocardioidaceae bacterium]